jgi:hypothetical protein
METGERDLPRIEITAALESWKTALLAAKRKKRTVSAVHGAMTQGLAAWSAERGYTHLDKLAVPVLDRFVGGWKYAGITHRSRIDLMRSFLKFCVARKWILPLDRKMKR